MDLLTHIASRDDFIKKIEEILKKISTMSEEVFSARTPAPSPYMLFNHNTLLMIRVKELRLIIERLYNNRIELLKVDILAHMTHAIPPNSPVPSGFQEIMSMVNKIDEQIVLDFQTMLLFTSIALDELAHLAAYILNSPKPQKSSFLKILEDKPNGIFTLLQKYKADMLWLDVFSRLYRNKMIVHREKPWQIGHSRSSHGLDWQFTAPISYGWLSEAELEENRIQIEDFATKKGFRINSNLYNTLFELLNNLHQFDSEEQKKIYAIAETLGFNLPTFQAYAHKLADYLNACLTDLIEYSRNNFSNINLGAPTHSENR